MTETAETPTETPVETPVAPSPDEGSITDFGTPSEHASEVTAEREPASSGDPDPAPSHEGVNRVLIFLNEVAGGRKLVTAARELADKGASYFAVVAPQNQPAVGQLVATVEETREAAQSRVDVTQAVLAEFGIESESAVMDPDPFLAIDDAVRATSPDIVLLSALYESRYGLLRRDLVEWAKDNLGTRVEHIPVRVDDDAVKWGLTHTLVVATQTVNSPDLLARLKERAKSGPHRYTFISPRSGAVSREDVCASLAATLAELYREEIDATGAPMSPEPLPAVKNALEHYRVDDILISTLKGEKSKWLEEGLIENVKAFTDKPVEHLEASPSTGGSSASRPGPPGQDSSRVDRIGAGSG